MSQKCKLGIVIIVLVIANLVSGMFLVRAWWENKLCDDALWRMARYAAALQASADFRDSQLRLYELAEDGELRSTNRCEGPFEIWYWPTYRSLGRPGRSSDEIFIKGYNSSMRNMHEHAEKSKGTGDKID